MKLLKKTLSAVLTASLLFTLAIGFTGCNPQASENSDKTEKTDDSADKTDKKDESDKKDEADKTDDSDKKDESDKTDDSDKKDDTTSKPTDSELTTISSVDFAKKLTIGWNLGNTLDANDGYATPYATGLAWETQWQQYTTTKEMIKAVHAAGFETIRIPVSWHNHISDSDTTNYKIDAEWMARVKEVVDYAIDDGMYVILNIHHDNAPITAINSRPGFAVSSDTAIQTKSKAYIQKVWTQIATEFASYDNHLVFEVLNEPRDMGGKAFSNEDESKEFSPTATVAATAQTIITSYEQVGLNAIRAVSGNEKRFVMCPGYAAGCEFLDTYTLPTDSATDKLLLSTHAYSPYDFAMGDLETTTFTDSHKSSLDSMFLKLKKNYTKKGIGVVMGEASASDKNNLAEREKWATYYFTLAAKAGIPVVLWDNLVTYPTGTDAAERHGHLNRANNSWFAPTLIAKMVAASKTATDLSDAVETGLLDSVLDLTSWSVNTSLAATKFTSATSTTSLKFTVEKSSNSTDASGTLKLQDKWGDDATILGAGTLVSGGSKGDNVFNVTTPGTFIYTPTASEWTKIKANGLIVYGEKVKVTYLELKN